MIHTVSSTDVVWEALRVTTRGGEAVVPKDEGLLSIEAIGMKIEGGPCADVTDWGRTSSGDDGVFADVRIDPGDFWQLAGVTSGSTLNWLWEKVWLHVLLCGADASDGCWFPDGWTPSSGGMLERMPELSSPTRDGSTKSRSILTNRCSISLPLRFPLLFARCTTGYVQCSSRSL